MVFFSNTSFSCLDTKYPPSRNTSFFFDEEQGGVRPRRSVVFALGGLWCSNKITREAGVPKTTFFLSLAGFFFQKKEELKCYKTRQNEGFPKKQDWCFKPSNTRWCSGVQNKTFLKKKLFRSQRVPEGFFKAKVLFVPTSTKS